MLTLQPGHALAAGRLKPGALAGEAVLLLEEGHCLRDQATLVCRELGLRPLPLIQASSVETTRQMLALGLGLAVLPELATIGPFAASGLAVRPLDGDAAGRLLTPTGAKPTRGRSSWKPWLGSSEGASSRC